VKFCEETICPPLEWVRHFKYTGFFFVLVLPEHFCQHIQQSFTPPERREVAEWLIKLPWQRWKFLVQGRRNWAEWGGARYHHCQHHCSLDLSQKTPPTPPRIEKWSLWKVWEVKQTVNWPKRMFRHRTIMLHSSSLHPCHHAPKPPPTYQQWAIPLRRWSLYSCFSRPNWQREE
jgi:hypothetical protein